jgi:hypothetical protein
MVSTEKFATPASVWYRRRFYAYLWITLLHLIVCDTYSTGCHQLRSVCISKEVGGQMFSV